MKSPRNMDLKEILGELLREDALGSAPLTPEELTAWKQGDLSEEARSQLLERILLDPDAVAVLADDSSTGMKDLKPDQTADSWRKLEEKLFQEEVLTEASVVPAVEDKISEIPTNPSGFWRMAAGLSIAAALCLGAWVTFLLGEISQLNYPNTDLVVESRFIDESPNRNDEKVRFTESLTLHLPLHSFYSKHHRWEFKIYDGRDRLVSTIPVSAVNLILNLELKRDFLKKPGNYRVEVWATDNNGSNEVYSMNIELK